MVDAIRETFGPVGVVSCAFERKQLQGPAQVVGEICFQVLALFGAADLQLFSR